MLFHFLLKKRTDRFRGHVDAARGSRSRVDVADARLRQSVRLCPPVVLVFFFVSRGLVVVWVMMLIVVRRCLMVMGVLPWLGGRRLETRSSVQHVSEAGLEELVAPPQPLDVFERARRPRRRVEPQVRGRHVQHFDAIVAVGRVLGGVAACLVLLLLLLLLVGLGHRLG